MRDPKFHNKDGTLTRYALACGYQEKHETENPNIITRLYLDGGFYVCQFNHTTGERLYRGVTHNLKTARHQYRALVRKAKELTK